MKRVLYKNEKERTRVQNNSIVLQCCCLIFFIFTHIYIYESSKTVQNAAVTSVRFWQYAAFVRSFVSVS